MWKTIWRNKKKNTQQESTTFQIVDVEPTVVNNRTAMRMSRLVYSENPRDAKKGGKGRKRKQETCLILHATRKGPL